MYLFFDTETTGTPKDYKAHDAANDVEATAKCFFELVKRKLIQLQ